MKKHKTILFRVYKNITRYNQKNMSNPITKEEEDELPKEPSAGNPNMPLPPFQEQKTQALSEQQQPTVIEESSSRSNPQQETTSQQQPIAATTAAGVTAPKPKVDFTATDATIQGLLIQAIALYHNKTQQQQQQQE